MRRWWSYFGRLFPSRQGFSPYRFPGAIVHIPFTIFILVFGILLCAEYPWLWPLIPVYLIVGLYLGRDLAIMAHYNLFITLVVIAGIIFLPLNADSLKKIADSIAVPFYGLNSFLISAIVIAGFYFYVRHWVVSETAEEKDAELRAVSPLHFAAERGNIKRCRALLAANRDLNPGNQPGLTPLHIAAENGNIPLVGLLLEYGADINLKTREDKIERLRDCTPLHYAAEQGREKMVEFLLQRGAAVNVRTFHQYTPLHYAALQGSLKIAQMLAEAGADISAVEVGGFTALQLAENFENKKVADFLRKIR